jgi:membrane protease YdiL (CAAX protease family)
MSHRATYCRQRVEALVERVFPGMGLRPAWLTLVSAICLSFYLVYGRWSSMPDWFFRFSSEWTGIALPSFHRAGWSHLSALVILMIVPFSIGKLIEGWRPADFGLSLKGAHKEFLICICLWLALLPILWFVSETFEFQRAYPRLDAVKTSGFIFVTYHLYYLIKWIAWEFFFRGFMLFGFKKDLGSRAVLISTLPFVVVHMNKPTLEMLGSVAGGFILCWIALRSRSIWPGVFLHWLVYVSLEFFGSIWWR